MAILKKILSYEICLWDIEGNALRGIPLLLIRKNGFTEIVSFENGKVTHEMGDKIAKASVRNSIYTWIINNQDKLLEEYNLANSYSFEYQPKNF